ncbi:hypothetical protein AB0N05_15055 [Nocardia sp. NPDC051030]|uniref:hypothetical protein n=1 Tax=Nocardia sp. NPDC051030 TaxID=3155162 RepID=UPI0034408829
MNHIYIRTALIGVTAGIVTLVGIIAIDNYDPWDELQKAVARQRLSPTERQELDRLRAEREIERDDRDRARDQRTATTRAQFRPDLLQGGHSAHALEELSVPALINETERAITRSKSRWEPHGWWCGHRDALLDEFDRRTGWSVKRHLSELDQLRLDDADKRISDARFALPAAAPVPAISRTAPPRTVNRDFDGPDSEQ